MELDEHKCRLKTKSAEGTAQEFSTIWINMLHSLKNIKTHSLSLEVIKTMLLKLETILSSLFRTHHQRMTTINA